MAGFLITGGCGFIGKNLAASLINRKGVFVRIMDNFSNGSPDDFLKAGIVDRFSKRNNLYKTGNIEIVRADLKNILSLKRIFKGIDAVIHLAADPGVQKSLAEPLGNFYKNTLYSVELLEMSRKCGVEKFIFASSNAAVGADKFPICEKSIPSPLTPYGASKLAAEAYCSAYGRAYGISVFVLRFSNVYGPYSERKESVIAKFIKRACRGLPLEIYGTGEQKRDFIHSSDLVNAVLLAAKSDKSGLYQIASGREYSINRIAGIIKDSFSHKGVDVKIKYLSPLKIDPERNKSSIKKARDELGFFPVVGIKEGIEKLICYYGKGIWRK